MKKLLICICGLCLISFASFQASAWMNVTTVGGGVPAAPAGDSCTGGLIFSWYMENSDDVTVGGGCSALTDSTATLATGATYTSSANEFYSGSYALELNGATAARATFDISIENVDNAGRADFYFRIASWSDFKGIFTLYYDGTNYISLMLADSDDLRLTFRSSTNNNNLQTTALGLTTNTWYHAICRWRTNTGDANPELSIQIDSGAAQTLNDANMTGTASNLNILNLGALTAVNEPFTGQIDQFKIYSSWE